ncbi:hypothetical protein BGZ94_004123 [Podila epigama]|nr:hypothetical protein BGZ94_004123 [Podila epigama]
MSHTPISPKYLFWITLLICCICSVTALPLIDPLKLASNNSLEDPFSAPDFQASTAVMIMIIVNTSSGQYLSSELYFLIWLAVGIVGALVSFYLYHVGIVLAGAYGMFVVVAVIFTAAGLRNYIARYTLLAIFIILGGYLTKRYERVAVIVATSIGGAYMIMYGLDMFVQTGFRATYHVILSQSKAEFDPVPGTWVMIACVPVIAIFGIIWELQRHETPVGSWWFGIGAKPLPETPGEKKRTCCGFTLAEKRPKVPPKDKPVSETSGLNNLGSNSTLVDSQDENEQTQGRGCCGGWSRKRDNSKKKTPTIIITPNSPTPTVPSPPAAVATITMPSPYDEIEDAVEDTKDDKVEDAHKDVAEAATKVTAARPTVHETIGHTGFRKVVIDREEYEFSLDLEEKIHV